MIGKSEGRLTDGFGQPFPHLTGAGTSSGYVVPVTQPEPDIIQGDHLDSAWLAAGTIIHVDGIPFYLKDGVQVMASRKNIELVGGLSVYENPCNRQ